MIKKISRSKLDEHSLSLKKGSTLGQQVNEDYKKKIVSKPWGYEYLMFENKHVAVWILYLKTGDSTSMHCHPKKKSSLIVLFGQVMTSSLSAQFKLKSLEAAMIDKGAFHASEARSLDGALIMEVESPPDKSDLVRLKDKYGREQKGYENFAHISTELDKYQYLDFHEDIEKNKFLHKNLKDRNIRIQRNKTLQDLMEYLEKSGEAVICFLDNALNHADGSVVCGIGDIITKTELVKLDINNFKINDDFDTLIIH